MPNIILVGFMGTGKTVVGQELSNKLNMPLIDTDDVIEEDSCMIISDIFAQFGEPHFRDLESEAVRKVSHLDGYVISAGGGAVIRESNVFEFKKNGIVFCLNATPETIFKRVSHETHRPLLQTEDPMKRIRELLEQRAPYYARADYTIKTSGRSVSDIASEIARIFAERSLERKRHHG
jgi:shikimate kinase